MASEVYRLIEEENTTNCIFYGHLESSRFKNVMILTFIVSFFVICAFPVLTLRIPTSLGASSGKEICGGKRPLSIFWAPMRNVSPCRLQHVQINLHPFYMEPLRKRCYFLQTEQNSTLLTCLLSPAAERIRFRRRQQAGRKPRLLSSCSGLLWQWRLPADKWSISPHVQVLRAYRCPGHISQFPAGSFVLGFALTVDILGPVMPDAIVFFWNLQERPAELLWKESF